MVFSSLVFLFVFLPATFVFYFLNPNKTYRNIVLIISSLFFYAWGEPVWVSLLVFTSFFDYCNGVIVERFRGGWQSRLALAASVIVNLSILFFFKYSAFLTINLNQLLGLSLPYSNYRLPIGISFYTFQTLSYVIDVYRGEVEAQKSPLKLLLFVSLFHQLVAGPIVRYKDIAAQIENRVILQSQFIYGINRFIIGLGKKVIIANTAGEIANTYLNGNLAALPVAGAWYGILLFSIQIYFDFSGYSDMAIGLGKMFGFTYKENFNYPYISRSATEFWRRWHISLGSFFRDYVYIPLGGNRKHKIINLVVVWMLTGLWHGASWNFVIWGLYYGLLIILEKLLAKTQIKLPKVVGHGYLITAALVGWVFFYFTDLSKGLQFLGIMFGFSKAELINTAFTVTFYNNVVYLALAVLACTPVFSKGFKYVKAWAAKSKGQESFMFDDLVRPVFNLAVLAVSIILLIGQSYNPFLYFRF